MYYVYGNILMYSYDDNQKGQIIKVSSSDDFFNIISLTKDICTEVLLLDVILHMDIRKGCYCQYAYLLEIFIYVILSVKKF